MNNLLVQLQFYVTAFHLTDSKTDLWHSFLIYSPSVWQDGVILALIC